MQIDKENLAAVRAVAMLAEEMHQSVYLVGGAVRDMLVDRPLRDLDFACSGDIFNLARRFADERGGNFFVLHEQWPAARVISTDGKGSRTFDFSALKGTNIAVDLPRRDFTINAMAIDVKELASGGEVIDPLNGWRATQGPAEGVLPTPAAHDQHSHHMPSR